MERVKKYEVKIYHSTFCTYEVGANSKEEAIEIARLLEIEESELLGNLENWEDADEVKEINETGK